MAGEYVDENGNPLIGPPGQAFIGPPGGMDGPSATPPDPTSQFSGPPRLLPNVIPTGKPGDPTIAGWAKHAVFGGTPQAEVPLSEVPGIVAGAPGAVAKAFQEGPKKGPASPAHETDDAVPGGEDGSEHAKENERILKLAHLMQGGGGNGIAQAYFQKEGESYAGVKGHELYNEAFVGAPGRRAAALDDLGALQAKRADEMAAMYDRQAVQDQKLAEAAAIRRQNEQEELAHKQEQLGKATKYYTRDLNDQGKFWANPGNILAAISYSLMPIFSNDPTVGVKLINQAIQQDMDNRQKAADHNLGAMRSNLDGYRKLAGDRQNGDLLAQAEAHRMAAQEITRIGAKYAGPEAQKNIAIARADQEQRAAAAEMEFYAKFVHKDAKKTVPGETAALAKGPNGFHVLGEPEAKVPGVNVPGKPGSPVMGTVAGGPSLAGNKGLKNPVIGAIARTAGPAGVTRLMDAHPGKIDDKDVENVAIMLVRGEAARRFPGNPGGYEKLMGEYAAKIAPVAMEMQKTSGTRALIAKVRSDMDIIDKTERYDGKDPEKFISWAETAWPKDMLLNYRKLMAKDPEFANGKSEKAALWRQRKVDELRSSMTAVFNDHTHEMFGGSQSTMELQKAAMAGLTDKASFYQMQRYLDQRSMALQKQQTDLRGGLTHPMERVLLRNTVDDGMADTYLPQRGTPAPEPLGPMRNK